MKMGLQTTKKRQTRSCKRIRECANDNSTTLNLAFLELSLLPAGVFEHLTQLEYLDLNLDHLSTFPENLFKDLTQLVYLNLSDNNLSTLPENLFKDLTQLIYLDLSNNQLDRLPSEISQLHQLKYLCLSGNDHIKLPLSILELNIDFDESKLLYYAVTQTINNNTLENRVLIQELLDKPRVRVCIDRYRQALEFESTSKDSRVAQLIEEHVLVSSKNYETRDNTLYTHCLRQKALRLWKSSATSSHFTLSKTLNGHTYCVNSKSHLV